MMISKFKIILLFAGCILIFQSGFGQQLTAELSNFRGVNVSCHGASNGSINLVLPVNPGLCSFLWNTGATTEDISNLSGGTYAVTVTMTGGTVLNGSWTLTEPEPVDANATLSDYSGFNISVQSGSDGEITLEPVGGVAPYSILWSTGKTGAQISQLHSGNYAATVTDVNGCTVIKTYTLNEPSKLEFGLITISDFGGYGLSCPDSRDGTIEVNVSGGIPPYTFNWNNGELSNRLESLDAGEYTVHISDNGHSHLDTTFILGAPPQMEVILRASTYPNGNSISCYDCYNGYIKIEASSVHGGLTYLWSNNATADSIFSLGAGSYVYTVTDQNNCQVVGEVELSQPERDDWQIGGNRNLNPTTQFLGTIDTSTLVFKSNNIERFSLDSSGNFRIKAFAGAGDGLILADSNGVLKKAITPLPSAPIWRTSGNSVNAGEFLGSTNAEDLVIKTSDNTRAKFLADGTFNLLGKMNSGTSPLSPENYFQIIPDATQFPAVTKILTIDPGALSNPDYGLIINTSTTYPVFFPFAVFKPDLTTTCSQGEFVFRIDNDGYVQAKDIRVFPNGWCDYVFKSDYSLMTLSDRKAWIYKHKHLPGMPDEREVEKDGVSVEQMLRLQLKQIEELNLYIIQLEEKISALEKSLK